MWNTTDGSQCFHRKGHAELVKGLAFSLDGSTLISSGGNTIQFWDALTGDDLGYVEEKGVARICRYPKAIAVLVPAGLKLLRYE